MQEGGISIKICLKYSIIKPSFEGFVVMILPCLMFACAIMIVGAAIFVMAAFVGAALAVFVMSGRTG